MALSSARPYAESVGLIAAATLLGYVTDGVLGAANINMAYLLVVLVIALRWGRRPALFGAILSAVVFDLIFVPPFFSFATTDLAYLTTLLGFVVIAIATSALASRARELTQAQAARARAEARSEAKDEVLHKVSHELRSPLNALLGWTQLLAQPEFDPDRASKAAAGIQRSGQMLGRLIDDLGTASRINSGKLTVDCQPIRLDLAVANAVATMAAVARQKGVQLESAIEPVGSVQADELRVEQITTNLVSNAIKFTPPGGRVVVRLHRTAAGAELVVADTGDGITPEFLPRVFEQFSQAETDHAREGLGLGMAIVKYLVAAHGWKVTVASDGRGCGATFTVRCHANAAPAVSSEPAMRRDAGEAARV